MGRPHGRRAAQDDPRRGLRHRRHQPLPGRRVRAGDQGASRRVCASRRFVLRSHCRSLSPPPPPPHSQVNGITLSKEQVKRGMQLAKERGLDNVDLNVMNALEMCVKSGTTTTLVLLRRHCHYFYYDSLTHSLAPRLSQGLRRRLVRRGVGDRERRAHARQEEVCRGDDPRAQARRDAGVRHVVPARLERQPAHAQGGARPGLLVRDCAAAATTTPACWCYYYLSLPPPAARSYDHCSLAHLSGTRSGATRTSSPSTTTPT